MCIYEIKKTHIFEGYQLNLKTNKERKIKCIIKDITTYDNYLPEWWNKKIFEWKRIIKDNIYKKMLKKKSEFKILKTCF